MIFDIHGSQKFKWDAVPGATSYNVRITEEGFVRATQDGVTAAEIPVLPLGAVLVPGPVYIFLVQAVDPYGVSDWTLDSAVAFRVLPPLAPANVRVE